MKQKTIRDVALDVLLQIEKNQAYSNLLLNQTVKKANLDQRDVGLLTEIVYGTVQRRDTLDFYLEPFIKKGVKKLDDWVRVLLRLSLYQMIYLDRVPDRAIVHEAVTIAKRRGHQGISGMVNGVLRNVRRQELRSFDEVKDDVNRLAIETSHPLWLVRRLVAQYGFEEARQMCLTNLEPPQVTVRVNQTKASIEEAIELLSQEGIDTVRGYLSNDALIIEKGNVTHTEAFKNGVITIQDESSMLVARALAPEEGMHVLDCCAAPGGKSTHLAEQMNDKGRVTALDLHDHKVKLIQQLCERLQLKSVAGKTMDARLAKDSFEKASFDAILVDAPCSGLGVIRRKPDIKWTKSVKDIEAIQNIQKEILTAVVPLLKPGGRLVYSTCTIDRTENEEMVQWFLDSHDDFRLDSSLSERLPQHISEKAKFEEGSLTILPHHFNTDGFFITAMIKQ
ncbi:16S rRNA (cytosine(967)-C(5))-methyltransferase RsmB [Alkalihalobacterium chitinilyticum]|uniref:16S rRNA (cytosine(967)-C(5))-methyltransferase n=1 Tax=Alkalihalobacterium chitinilyticum TaxID=2980103 RepID=A0ABT5VC43_9BACI|nr:16S rRNA (cytosine(967)-C(5))-methyltransferase RsmB [Alkalihalobacterium chitinilyticum]MDE5413018.1 16S rRNA (cytosine(967)-C(5))-methyltransferase RsmB [Alkalihalobacterium chitinilyticum]